MLPYSLLYSFITAIFLVLLSYLNEKGKIWVDTEEIIFYSILWLLAIIGLIIYFIFIVPLIALGKKLAR